MLYRATHVTRYFYEQPVSESQSEAYLRPRDLPGQRILSTEFTVNPTPSVLDWRKDYFGNHVVNFSVLEPHTLFIATATSLVEVLPRDDNSLPEIAWEEARRLVHLAEDDHTLAACEFLYDSPFVPLIPELAELAQASFLPGKSMTHALIHLCGRIYEEFEYRPGATTIEMPLAEVFRSKMGVCQDYAHVMIGSLRALGLPARYVSGYLRSGEQFIGAEASHAWVSAFIPGHGWLDLDPTNNMLPSDGHVTLAWGRDYGDVAPMKGLALGGGQQIVDVDVRMRPAESDAL